MRSRGIREERNVFSTSTSFVSGEIVLACTIEGA